MQFLFYYLNTAIFLIKYDLFKKFIHLLNQFINHAAVQNLNLFYFDLIQH